MEKSQPENARPEGKPLVAARTDQQKQQKTSHEGLSKRDIELRKKIAERFGRQADHLDLNNIMKEEAEKKRRAGELNLLAELQKVHFQNLTNKDEETKTTKPKAGAVPI